MDNEHIIECSECGHLHFDNEVKAYEACPLASEGCTCPMDVTLFVCPDCDERYDRDRDGSYWSEVTGKEYCDSCWDQSFAEGSSAWLVGEGEPQRFLVTDHGVFDHEYLEEVHEEILTRTYHRTDGWRGYYETKPVGEWKEAAAGWTTGNWGDAISDSKQDLNRWIEAVIHGEISLDHPIWIIADHTSNVFSTAIGIFIPTDVEDVAVPTF